jgi:sugar lactone lactonase YvrE
MRTPLRALCVGALAVALGAPGAACGDDDGSDDGSRADAGDGGDLDAGADAAPDAGGGVRDAIRLPGNSVYPEGVASLADGTLFVGSVSEGTIFRVPPDAAQPEQEPFASGGDNGLLNTVGLLADEERGRLWACSSDAFGAGTSPPGLKAFDLTTGDAAGSFDLPGGGFCNDVALDAAGNVYLTDSLAPRILRLPAGGQELEIWLEDERFGGEGFNLNGIEVGGEDLYTVKYNSGQLFRVTLGQDGEPGEVAEIELDRPLESPDGMRLESKGRLIVVEGVGRLTRIQLGGASATLTVVRDLLNGPTTATLVGGDAWVVEGQLAHLFDPKSGEPDLPFQLVRVPLE